MLYYQGGKYNPDVKPKRIISVVPSQTELLYYLDNKPIAQTIFCIHPQSSFKSATKIGGTKKLNIAKIRYLNPDLIIANKEENDQGQIEELAAEFDVWLSDIITIDNALEMIADVGRIVGKEKLALNLINALTHHFQLTHQIEQRSCLYLIWREPYMAAGKSTFIDAILETYNLTNVLNEERYPVLTNDSIEQLKPELILLSSEPYPFKHQHIDEIKKLSPTSKVLLADGELFSWYGNRLLKSATEIPKLLREK